MVHNDPNTPGDRLKANLKSPYPDEDSTWEDIIKAFAQEFDDYHTTITTIDEQNKIEEATDAQLDKIGSFLQLKRNTGESDPHYRGRLKVQLRKFLGSGTVDEIKETAAILLDAELEDIQILEDFDTEYARFQIGVWQDDLDDAGVTDSEFRSFIDEVRGAGIRTDEFVRGTFTYRSEQDFIDGTNDPGKGYYDPNDSIENGTYAGLL